MTFKPPLFFFRTWGPQMEMQGLWCQTWFGNDTGGAKDQRHSKYTIIDNVDANNCHRTTTLTFDPDITHDLDIANDLELWPWPSRSTPKFVRNNSAVHLDRAWLLSCLKRRVQDLSNGIWHPIFASAMQPIKSNQYSEYQILFSELETLSSTVKNLKQYQILSSILVDSHPLTGIALKHKINDLQVFCL